MPLIVGSLVMKIESAAGGYQDHEAMEVAGENPGLVRGGGRASDRVNIERTGKLPHQHAKGIVYGRNVIQHGKPAAMSRARS